MSEVANVKEMSGKETPPPSIAEEYSELEDTIEALATRVAWWSETLEHDEMMSFLDEMNKKAEKQSISWSDPTFKPKDFIVDQARVIATNTVIGSFQRKAMSVSDDLASARQRKSNLEARYPLLLRAMRS